MDDRPVRAGVKFSDAELVGIPFRVTVGKRGLAAGTAELTDRATGIHRRDPAGRPGPARPRGHRQVDRRRTLRGSHAVEDEVAAQAGEPPWPPRKLVAHGRLAPAAALANQPSS